MKEIGLEDLDMNVLDEDDFEFKENFSCSSQKDAARSQQAAAIKPSEYPYSSSSPSSVSICKSTKELRLTLAHEHSIFTPNFGNRADAALGLRHGSHLKDINNIAVEKQHSSREGLEIKE